MVREATEGVGTAWETGKVAELRLAGMIFDLDGTLGDTLPLCIASFRHAFEGSLGRRLSDEEIIARFGPSEEGTCRELAPEGWQTVLKAYLKEYERGHERFTEAFPGIEDALDLLKARGLSLAVVTGKGRRSADISLGRFGLTGYFDSVEIGSPDGPIKPTRIRKVLSDWGLAPDEVAYVGDSSSDTLAAREVGVAMLGAGWADTATVDAPGVPVPLVTFASVDEFIGWIERNVRPREDTIAAC